MCLVVCNVHVNYEKLCEHFLNWMNEYTPRMHTHTLISAMKRKRNENKRQFMTRNFRVGFFSLSSFLIHFSLVRFCLDFNPERNGKDFHKIVFDLSTPSHGRTVLRFFFLLFCKRISILFWSRWFPWLNLSAHMHTHQECNIRANAL